MTKSANRALLGGTALAALLAALALVSPAGAQETSDTPTIDAVPQAETGPQTQGDQQPGDTGEAAQTGDAAATAPPMSILPGPKVPPPDETKAATPATPGEQGAPADNGAQDTGEGVQIGALARPDPSSIGTLDDTTGGFGWTLWQGSDLTVVETLMAHLPGNLTSPALQDLSRRLLLTSAAVPKRLTQAPAGDDKTPPTFLSVRLDRLAAAGRLDDSAQLIDSIAPFSVDEALEERRADIALLQGARDKACSLAETALQRSGAAYWLRLAAFCQAESGDVDRAGRTLELLSESGKPDAMYNQLMGEVIGGQTGKVPDGLDLRTLTPLSFSMVTALKIPLGADILLTDNPMLLTAVAGSDDAEPPVRLQALEQAAGLGAVPLSRLTKSYEAQTFSDKEKAQALDQVFTNGGARQNALFYQLVSGSQDAATRLKYLSAALGLARRQGQYPLIARLYLDATRSIEPSPDYLASAGEVVRALLINGASDRAFEWYDVVRRAASAENIAATGTLLDIWPLFHLAGRDTGVPYSDQILSLWWQAQITAVGEERIRRGRLLYTLLEAMDYVVPERFWTELITDPMIVSDPSPSLPVWRDMLRATAAGRKGEAVLASLDGLGSQGLANASLAAISSLIGQYRQLGLDKDANRIAVEVAISRGL